MYRKMITSPKRYTKWKDFEPQLQIGDILLISQATGPIANSIKKRTHSHWTHVAMIFAVPDKKTLFDNVLIIEALDHGIEIHRIQEYTHHLDIYDIGVKRIPHLTNKERKRVIAFMLDNVDVPYSFTKLFINFLLTFNIPFLQHYLHRFAKRDDFVCTTFIQKAYYKAVRKELRKNIVFRQTEDTLMVRLEEVTPSDIARDSFSKWIFKFKRKATDFKD